MKYLIIGGSGFVGGYLTEKLLSLDDKEVFATKLPAEEKKYPVKYHDLDITDCKQTEMLIAEVCPDVIFHLAAQSSVKLSWEKPQLTADINIKGAINVLEAVRKECPKCRLVVIGSSEEYGKIDYSRKVSEETVPNPRNIYAVTKLAQENLASIYAKAYGLDVILVRAFNHVGPRQSTQFVVSDFCNQVAMIEKGLKDPVMAVGNLASYRDFLDVRDVVNAYVYLAKKGKSGEVYNVGSGRAIRIEEILDIILRQAIKAIRVIVDPDRFRPIDIPIVVADNTKLLNLGWTQTISIEQTIADTLNYFREQSI